MTNQETLTKAIEKAIAGGWNPKPDTNEPWAYDDATPEQLFSMWFNGVPESFIFNHDFAKALWGEDEVGINEAGKLWKGARAICIATQPFWQSHLQEMVIADDPIKYLSENL